MLAHDTRSGLCEQFGDSAAIAIVPRKLEDGSVFARYRIFENVTDLNRSEIGGGVEIRV